MAADDESHGPGLTERVGGHLSVATSAGRGRGPSGFSVELPPLTGGGPHASRTWQAKSFEAIHPLPAFGMVFRPLIAGFVVQLSWSGSRTRDRRLMRSLLYPTELSSGGHPRIELGTLRCNPLMAGISGFQRRGMCNIHGRIRMPHTGEPPRDSWRPVGVSQTDMACSVS